jgi:hypothetical protein
MKMKKIMLLLGLLGSVTAFAQNTNDLYMPREYQEAYRSETRSHEGTPGRNYFQNEADYKISAEFFPESKILIGSETITYKNNSPDTLALIYFNLYQNVFRKGEARDSYIDTLNIHNGAIIKAIRVNDASVDPNKCVYFSTLMTFRLPEGLIPGGEIEIDIEWEQTMPKTGMFRIGTYDETSSFIGYWYPKVNVYDDIVGWNIFGFTGNAEFYNDYGNYEVDITVPADFQVWSSGMLQNAEEIFNEKYLSLLKMAGMSDSVISIISPDDRIKNKITKPAQKHCWKFKAGNMPDFAFAVSNRYLWDATSLQTGEGRVIINSVYNPESENFRSVADISRKAITFYSNRAPAIPYPYPILTVFNGEKNGMEFPGIINDQEEKGLLETMLITTHEIAHSYFPFLVGTNEQEYAWMDEGLASIIGIWALADISGLSEAQILQLANQKYNNQAASLAVDIPLMSGTHHLGDFTSGFTTYVRPIAAFSLLLDYMGTENFYSAIREFADRWKGKHPIPYDMFYTFNYIAGEDLGWFWKPWFFDLGYADLGIGDIVKQGTGTTVEVVNHGGFPVPINLMIEYSDGSRVSFHEKMNIWNSGRMVHEIEIPGNNIKEIAIEATMPEAFYENNFKKMQ